MTSRKMRNTNASDLNTPAARVRENQRRSRARKREYVASLEERLRRCQAEGAEKNEKIQAAARKVAAENRALRELLREKGVDECEIAARVGAEIQEPRPPTSPSCSTTSASCSCACSSTSARSLCPSSSCGAESASTSSLRPCSPPMSLEVDSMMADASLLSAFALLPPTTSTVMPSHLVQPTSEAAQQNDILSLVEGPSLLPAPAQTIITHPCPCEADSYLYPETEDLYTSTPCTVAYQLLQAVGLQAHRDVDDMIINIELWGAFRAAPLFSFEGCRVENNALLHVLTKAITGSLYLF